MSLSCLFSLFLAFSPLLGGQLPGGEVGAAVQGRGPHTLQPTGEGERRDGRGRAAGRTLALTLGRGKAEAEAEVEQMLRLGQREAVLMPTLALSRRRAKVCGG